MKTEGSAAGDSVAPSAVVSKDPFAEAMSALQGAKAGSSSSAPVASSVSSSSLKARAPGKKRKSVTWAEGDKLEMIKEIERAVYDDDQVRSYSCF